MSLVGKSICQVIICNFLLLLWLCICVWMVNLSQIKYFVCIINTFFNSFFYISNYFLTHIHHITKSAIVIISNNILNSTLFKHILFQFSSFMPSSSLTQLSAALRANANGEDCGVQNRGGGDIEQKWVTVSQI